MTDPARDLPGRYQVRRELGRGAMGVVYEALDTELNRPVAVKMMHPEMLGSRELAARFRREAHAAAALRHPNVVTIHDFGAVEGKHAYLVMELLEGRSLREEITQGGPLSSDRTVEILRAIGSALEAAHQLQLIHRDVKPENIFLARAGDLQIPKILDFGIVKALAPEEAPTRGATIPGQLIGTLRYMSPEQLRGEVPSPGWDLWALAVVAYEMLSGAHPFPDPAAHRKLILGQLECGPVEAGPESAAWNRFFAGALAADAAQRPASAREFVSRLPGQAPTVNLAAPEQGLSAKPAIRVRRQPIRRRLLLAASALLLLGAAAAAYFVAAGRGRLDSLAILPFMNTSGDAAMDYLSDGISENLINTVSQLPEISVISRGSTLRYKSGELDPKEAGRKLGVRAVLLGRMLRRGDQLSLSVELVDARNGRQLWGRRYDRKLVDLLEIQEDISREIAGALRIELTSTERKRLAKRPTSVAEAHELYLKGRFYWNKRSRDGLKKGIDFFKQAIEKDPAYALAYAGLADCYALQAGWTPPREICPMARGAALKALELDEGLAEAHASLAFVRTMYEWDWAGAERECRRALELNANYAMAHSVFSRYLSAMGRFDEALREAERAQQLDPLSLGVRSAFATTYYQARRHDEAIQKFSATLSLDSSFAPAHVGLGQAFAAKGRTAEALASFEEALKANATDTAVLAEIGRLHGITGRSAEARQSIEKLREISRQRYVSPYFLALPYLGLGDKGQTYDWLEKAYQDRSWPMTYLKVEPKFDSLRAEPRFQDILKRIGF